MAAEDVQDVYELREKRSKYASLYLQIAIRIYIIIFVDDEVWRTVYWLTTQYPQISIKSEKWMNSSKNYWEKRNIWS